MGSHCGQTLGRSIPLRAARASRPASLLRGAVAASSAPYTAELRLRAGKWCRITEAAILSPLLSLGLLAPAVNRPSRLRLKRCSRAAASAGSPRGAVLRARGPGATTGAGAAGGRPVISGPLSQVGRGTPLHCAGASDAAPHTARAARGGQGCCRFSRLIPGNTATTGRAAVLAAPAAAAAAAGNRSRMRAARGQGLQGQGLQGPRPHRAAGGQGLRLEFSGSGARLSAQGQGLQRKGHGPGLQGRLQPGGAAADNPAVVPTW
jgi:hypothetical protein